MSFLIDFLRPTASEGPSWFSLLKNAGGGCNDLLYSGHMLVAVLTAMAWTVRFELIQDCIVLSSCDCLHLILKYALTFLTSLIFQEAYGGFSSALVWLLVMHSAQREIRERHHYSVDCIVAIYVGILLWKMTGFIWSHKTTSGKFEKIQGRLIQAAKDSDIDKVRELLKDIELSSEESRNQNPTKYAWLLRCAIIFVALIIVVLAFILTSDG